MDYRDDNKAENSTLNENTSEDTVVTPKRRKQNPASQEQTSHKSSPRRAEAASKNDINRKGNASVTDKNQYSFFKKTSDPDSAFNIAMTYVLAFVAIYFAFCIFSDAGAIIGRFIRFICFGLFSTTAYVIPFFLLLQGITWRQDIRRKAILRKIISTFIALLFLSSLFYLRSNILQGASFESIGEFLGMFFDWDDPNGAKNGGGVLGSLLGWCLYSVFGKIGTILIFALVILLYLIFFFNFNPKTFALKACKYSKLKIQSNRGKRDAKRLLKEEKIKEAIAKEEEENKKISAAEFDPLSEPKPPIRVQAKRITPKKESEIVPSLPQKKKLTNEENVAEKEKHEKFKNAFSEYTITDDANDEPDDFESTEEIAKKKMNSHEGVSSSTIDELALDRSSFTQGDEELDAIPKAKISTASSKSYSKNEIDDDDDDEISQSFDDIKALTKIENTPDKKSIPTPNPRVVKIDSSSSEAQFDDDNADEENITQKKSDAPTPNLPKYVFPPLSLLEKSSALHGAAVDADNDPIAINLRQTLKNFNVNTAVSNISRGPRITRYELVPDTGIRIRAIANLVDDISMALATAGIRIEAPIPGKAAVGVEVPNASPTTVRLRSLLDNEAFKSAPAKTTVCLGADIGGDAVYADIAKMPHMLIAGATGMGKSVCINTIITSILYKARPDEVKLILVDPKKVELNVYSGIPHLLIPVVSDPSQAAGALAWAVNEMESRFDKIEAEGVRNIKGYNKAIEGDPSKEPMCQIVIIIDELADLMMSSPDSVETSICRIAQKARAAGIHLIIGTQRPSVDVITGLIKANIPSRIAFHVSSQIDSRTILDTAGAEKLLNNGDMLFYPAGIPKPRRIQGAFVDDDEVERVTTFLKNNSKGAIYDDNVLEEIKKAAEKCAQNGKRKSDSDVDDGSIDGILDDPKFNAAIDVAFEANKISTSLLQRKLSIGFGRAAKYIDAMCDLGIVSEPDGQKPREVLMTRSEYYERKNRHEQ